MGDNSEGRKYEALKIPDRKPEQERGIIQPSSKVNAQPISSLADGIFYEIEYDSAPISDAASLVPKSKPQKIANTINPADSSENDQIRVLYRRMRDIAHEIRRTSLAAFRSTYDSSRFYDRRVQSDNAIIFHQQGLFMKDFTDDYAGNTQFSQYFPYYQMMGYEQFRTYFTWRTRVRQGSVAGTSMSYAFLYIYELLGNIGVTGPQDGLDKLMFFWKAFREHNKAVDRYVLRWLKDYHIYYELPHTFKEFVDKNDLTGHYPKLTETEDFDLFCSISKYNIKKSAFFTGETSKMISDCFAFVMDRIRTSFEAAEMNFDDALFRPTRKLVAWKPFKDALFCNNVKQRDRQIVLSESEIYLCRKNEWMSGTIITTEKGRQFISYVMKQMESTLRKITNYKFKLTANSDMVNDDTIRILTKAGLFIERIVTDAVAEYHRETTKTVVTVDHDALARIRQDALRTQEALLVEEENIVQCTVYNVQINNSIFADPADTEAPAAADVWDGLKDALSEIELRALAVVLQSDDIKAFADECGIMLEVLMDGINEKAMDYIGDNLLDDDFVIYDDYKVQVGDLLK